ncbi:MAG TPA: efflux RND transporter periplasmic adaptor subunit [Acetobacteraceae bacterium]|jgi:HlyD family secretion protein|nr:efflux RND transporter periplasmic adaptor subunit [Acetobacteraceae bacterium]
MAEETAGTPSVPSSAPTSSRAPAPAVVIVAVLFVAMIGLSIWYLSRTEPLVIQGEVQSRTFDMAARVDGRVADIAVVRSQNVTQGAPLIRIDNPELLAKERESEAALRVAEAELARVRAGFRAETIAVRKAEVDRANADLVLAQKTFDRTRQLVASHDSPQSQYDKDAAALTLAERTLDQAHFSYNEAVSGFTREDLGVALAKIETATADVQTLKSLVDQMVVIAPADSQVFRIPIEDGEVVLPGVPLITLVDLNDMWVQFDLREDLLRDLKVGSTIDVRVPALGDRVMPLVVRVIGAKGEYTGWRATRSSGDFDLRTFQVRAYPAQPVEGLRPGMSVYADWSQRRP